MEVSARGVTLMTAPTTCLCTSKPTPCLWLVFSPLHQILWPLYVVVPLQFGHVIPTRCTMFQCSNGNVVAHERVLSPSRTGAACKHSSGCFFLCKFYGCFGFSPTLLDAPTLIRSLSAVINAQSHRDNK